MNHKVKQLLKAKFGQVRAASNGQWRIVCPTCDPKHSKKMKRYIDPSFPKSSCFICHVAIPLKELMGDNLNLIRSLSADDDTKDVEYKYAKILPYNIGLPLAELPANDPCLQFINRDHLFNYAYYDSLGIRYIPTNGGMNLEFDSGFVVNTANALFFPVYGKAGDYAGWQLRFIPGTWNGDRCQFMKYMHLFPKGNHLFNYAQAKQYDNVVVVEGVKKALKLANSVATLGKGISTMQKQLIQEWKTITIVLDGEDSTQELAKDIQHEFRCNGRRCINVDLRPYGFDSPDDTTTEQLQQIIAEENAKQQ